MQEEDRGMRAAPPDCQWPESCSSEPRCLSLCGCGDTSPHVQAYLLAVPITSLGHSLDMLPRWLSGQELPANAGDVGLISGSGRFPRKGNGYSLQYFCLGNPMDGGAWWAIVNGVPKSQKQLSD